MINTTPLQVSNIKSMLNKDMKSQKIIGDRIMFQQA